MGIKKAGLASRNIVHLRKKHSTLCRFLSLYSSLHLWSRLDHYIDPTYTSRIIVPVACWYTLYLFYPMPDAVSEFIWASTWLCSRAMQFQSIPTIWPFDQRVSSSSVVEHLTRLRRVVDSNPIWDSDFFRVYVSFLKPFFWFEASAQTFRPPFAWHRCLRKFPFVDSVNHNPELCTGVTLFALNYTFCTGVLHLNCTALSQSESSNFFMYVINAITKHASRVTILKESFL